MTTIAEYDRLLRQVLADAEQDHMHLKPTEEHAPTLAVYLTILQSANEAAVLLQQPTVTTGGILRSIVESYADLSVLVRTPDYAVSALPHLKSY